MLENIGTRDLIVRTILAMGLALVAVVCAPDLEVSGPAAVGAVWLAGTILTRRCPLYCVIGLSTCLPPALKTGPERPVA